MTAKVHRLRPPRHDTVAEALQLVIDLPSTPDTVRDGLTEMLGTYTPPDAWSFVMLNPSQQRAVLKAIHAGPRPFATVMVWNACISRLNYGTGEVMASRSQLSEDAQVRPEEVSKALTRLTEIGALLRLKPGRYAINPHVAWSGSQGQRQDAAKGTEPVQLRLAD